MNKKEFVNAIGDKKIDLDLYWNEFNSMTLDEFKEAIARTKNFKEMKDFFKKQNTNISRINLNSSYWYCNLREQKPFYDITKGVDALLEPYKKGVR